MHFQIYQLCVAIAVWGVATMNRYGYKAVGDARRSHIDALAASYDLMPPPSGQFAHSLQEFAAPGLGAQAGLAAQRGAQAGFASRTFRNEGIIIRGNADPYSGEPYIRHRERPFDGMYPGLPANMYESYGAPNLLGSHYYGYGGFDRGYDTMRADQFRRDVEAEKMEQDVSRLLAREEKWVHGDPWLLHGRKSDSTAEQRYLRWLQGQR